MDVVRARSILVMLGAIGLFACSRHASTTEQKPVASSAEPKAVVDAPAKTLAPPPRPFEMASDEHIRFDATGKNVVVLGEKTVRFYEADTGALVEDRPLPSGRRVANHARGVLLLTDEEERSFEIYDLKTGKTSKLPDSWFPREPDSPSGTAPSISESGARIGVFTETDKQPTNELSMVIYDTNQRAKVSVLTTRAPVMAGGMYHGDLMPDGKSVVWCHSRGDCTLQSADGNASTQIGHFATANGKWIIDVPWSFGTGETGRPQIRDAATREIVGRIAKPPGFQGSAHPIVTCPDSDRVALLVPPTLVVYALPSGKPIAKFDTGGAADSGNGEVACAPGGHRVAWAGTVEGHPEIAVRKLD